MKVSEASTADYGVVGSMREGVLAQKFLLTGEDGSPNNYLLNVGRTGTGGWSTPRHKHNFDQIRYVIKGTYPYAKGKSMAEGSVGYFPEGVYYGPQDRPEGLEMLVCQFGGASGSGYLSVNEREAANARLKEKGDFQDGVFTYFDESGKRHNQDGFEACYEEATGRKMIYPKPRYDDVIMMNPENYEWVPDASPRVERKWLGSFTERDARVGFLRLEADATFSAGEQPSTEILFLTKGRVEIDDRRYGPHTAFEFSPADGRKPVKATEPTEFLCIVLPKF
ncbi:hypothetical protein LMG31506_04929 [Cupriavidus yeoncheonensis]|uniref:Cupin domain-containing protein n=1 Tax=Cupriavidus yeoncheonensis TaxID=1462994 RepID=A0A916IZI8_9BURK|nr:hypothetical protein [Cupriavidus yeoncheonensis]CAG2153863.1 hypothetical protein LMG31506_04929 [Cupriavidus yeoncheonensis]